MRKLRKANSWYVKARTRDSATDTVYTGWYTAVYLPEVMEPDSSGIQQSGQQGGQMMRQEVRTHEHETEYHD